MVDLSALSPAEKLELSARLADEAKREEEANKTDVIGQITALAASIGMEAKVTPKGGSAPKKKAFRYIHPSDPSKGWSGYGITPAWLKLLAGDGSIEQFRVN